MAKVIDTLDWSFLTRSGLDTRRDSEKESREQTVQRICQFLNLPFDKEMLEDIFKPNTSFTKGLRKEDVLSSRRGLFIRVASPFFNALPRQLYEYIYSVKVRFLGSGTENTFIPGTFTHIKREHGWQKHDVREEI